MSEKTKTIQPWYHEGLRFTCTGCGDCCTGAPGYVWVSETEIARIAELLGQSDIAAFEKQYVRKVGSRKSLKEHPNYDCIFLEGETRQCRVYSARPDQCRTWPFWDSNLTSPQTWNDTCRVCPGSGQGRLYQLGEIEAQRRALDI